MERLILSPRTEIFSGKCDFLKVHRKFPNRKCAEVFTSSRPYGLGEATERVVEMRLMHPRGNFHSDFDTFVNYITVDHPAFFRVNGKQPLFHSAHNVVISAC